mgnify:CR=1 FL=1
MDRVQMRSLVRAVTMDGALSPRDVFWTTESRAQHYIENKIAVPVGVGPGETKPLAAEETKEKKSSDVEMAGLQTDSAPLNESGKVESLSASHPAQASQNTVTSRRSLLTLPKRK